MKKIRILVIEQSPIVTAGISTSLTNSTFCQVVGTTNTLERINEKIIILKPDLILLNPSLIDYSKKITFKTIFQDFSQIPVVALVYAYFEQHWLKHFNGTIDITDDIQKIENRLLEIYHTTAGHTETTNETYELSDRETDVLIEVAKGLMNKEIATKLNISIHTVISHRKNINRKTGIKSVAGLTVYALLNNLIADNELPYR